MKKIVVENGVSFTYLHFFFETITVDFYWHTTKLADLNAFISYKANAGID